MGPDGDTHDKRTLDFYAAEASAYGARSDGLGISKSLTAFLAELPKGAAVLDLGCGTGRDTRALIDAGMQVTAVDGSPEMAREAERRLGIAVRVQLFEDVDDVAPSTASGRTRHCSTYRARDFPQCSRAYIAL